MWAGPDAAEAHDALCSELAEDASTLETVGDEGYVLLMAAPATAATWARYTTASRATPQPPRAAYATARPGSPRRVLGRWEAHWTGQPAQEITTMHTVPARRLIDYRPRRRADLVGALEALDSGNLWDVDTGSDGHDSIVDARDEEEALAIVGEHAG